MEEIESGDENGLGRTINLHTRELLPYILHWQAKVTEVQRPAQLVVEARGDLQGRGEWRLCQDGELVRIDYNWAVIGNKPWMRYLNPVLKPVFKANHRWAMRKGEQGLERELKQIRDRQNKTRTTSKSPTSTH